jgi:hypothetical protein
MTLSDLSLLTPGIRIGEPRLAILNRAPAAG